MNANASLLRGFLCLAAVPAMAGYFPIDPKSVYEYEGVASHGGIGGADADWKTTSTIRRTFSQVVSGTGDPYQRVTDSILEIDFKSYPMESVDTVFKIKRYKITYSDTAIAFDSLFVDFSFPYGYPRLNKSVFSSPLPYANFTLADGFAANACLFPLRGVSENCVKISRGSEKNVFPDYNTTIVFSEDFGIKETAYSRGDFASSYYGTLSLKRVFSNGDTLDFRNSEVVGLVNKEKRASYQGLDVIRRNRPVDIDVYSIQGKLLYSRKYGPGDAIELKEKPESAIEVIHFGSGDPTPPSRASI